MQVLQDVDIDELESLGTRKKELEDAISNLEISVKVLQSENMRNEDEATKVQKERNLSYDFLIVVQLYPSYILGLLLESPLIIFGRYRGDFPSTIQLKGVLADMSNFSIELKVQVFKKKAVVIKPKTKAPGLGAEINARAECLCDKNIHENSQGGSAQVLRSQQILTYEL
ncbi:hypothetical protein AgCh_006251 [Apium graveolens]